MFQFYFTFAWFHHPKKSVDFFGSCLNELFETTGLDILSMEMPTIEAVTQFHRHCTALDALNLDSVSVSPTELVLCHSTFSNVRKSWVSYILIYTYDMYMCYDVLLWI